LSLPTGSSPLLALPEPTRCDGAEVLVAGAGLAGLAAALELARRGHRVTVLEARQRVGGRVRTLRGVLGDGVRVEAGATFVPGNHAHVLGFAHALGVPLQREEGGRGAGRRYFVRGRMVTVGGRSAPEWPLPLAPHEAGLDPLARRRELLSPLLRRVGDPTQPGWPGHALQGYDAISLSALLASLGASPAAVELMGMGYLAEWGDGPEACSALSLLRDLAQQRPAAGVFRIAGGSARLPVALAAALPGRIRLGAVVRVIEHDRARVRVRLTTAPARREELSGHFLVCAIPFTCLRRIAVRPPLSAPKRAAIARLRSTSVTRVFLRLRPLPVSARGATLLTDLPLMLLADASPQNDGEMHSGAGVLEAFVTGPRARALALLSGERRVARTLELAERIYPGVTRAFQRGASYAWDRDPYARGDYAWFAPGELTTLGPHLAPPEGRIHFAGDHTSHVPGWMEGALASGVRAAAEIHRARCHGG
jgi:monoamine oxidase